MVMAKSFQDFTAVKYLTWMIIQVIFLPLASMRPPSPPPLLTLSVFRWVPPLPSSRLGIFPVFWSGWADHIICIPNGDTPKLKGGGCYHKLCWSNRPRAGMAYVAGMRGPPHSHVSCLSLRETPSIPVASSTTAPLL